jgi:acyl-homoserine-lactone acylase
VNRPVRRARCAALVIRCLAGALLIALTITLPLGAALASGSKRKPSRLSSAVTITRDRAGVPHIVARNFTALGYGEGYAFAQDNLCTFANDIVTVEGQRSRYFGPNGTAVNYSAGTATPNIQSDLYWRYVKATGIGARELSAPPPNGLLPQVRAVYAGFVRGYNLFLRSGKLRDPRCQGKPWVHPISLGDMMLRGQQVVTEGSAQQFLSDIVQAAPPTGQARGARVPRRVRGFAALNKQFGDQASRQQGSNAIGLGSGDTRSGHGMVLANPHFPWRGTERFWMAQLDVPGSYDVEGGSLEGFPLVGIGFNRNLAWTHTVSTSRRFVAYRLELVPGDPTSYYVDGKPVAMGHVTVSVRYGASTVTHTFYTTRWGVVLDVAAVPGDAYVWNTSTAYALYDAVGGDGPRAANQDLRMGQATSVRALYKVEAKWLAIPTFNTIAADDHGNAYYGDVGATPAVGQAELNTCLPAGIATLVFKQARIVTLDGSRSSCAPANYAGTPQKGIFSASRLPHIFRRDYVENSNDSFWLANPSHPLTGFSPIVGLTGTVQGLRTRIGNEMIAERVKGTDGLGGAKFTIPTLQRMWEGDRSALAELVLKDLVADCRAHPSQVASNGQTVDLTSACNALAGFDRTGLLGAKGGWLFSIWNSLDGDANFWTVPFDPAKPLTTPSGLNTGRPPNAPATPLKHLADAVLSLRAHAIALDASYADVQYAPQSRGIAIAGCNTGCFNAIFSSTGPTSNPVDLAPYGQVYDGSSLVMTTQLDPAGPVSQGILTYSQASDPTSRWYSNMTKLYSRRRWVTLPYTAGQLRQDHPGAALILQPH